MSLIDQIKARPENAGKGSNPKPAQPKLEVNQEEIQALNAELDSEIDAEITPEPEEKELSPEQLITRTKESLEDEVKQLRDKDIKNRIKLKEAKEKALAMADEVFKTEREEYDRQLAEMKKQLEDSKALKKEENKVEKEIINAESKAEQDMLRKELKELREANQKIQAQIQDQKDAEESERSLRKQAAENRFQSMLKEIPAEFQEAASMMFKGYTDSSEGLIAITKYKAQGLFGKKTIEVISRVPRELNNNENKPLSNREIREKRVSALKSRRQGLVPGAKL
jgi:chromosome segregation ATPase